MRSVVIVRSCGSCAAFRSNEAFDPSGSLLGVWNVLSHSWCWALARASVPYSLFTFDVGLTERQIYASVDSRRDTDVRSARTVYAVSTDMASRLAERFGSAVDIQVVSPSLVEPADRAACARRAAELARELELDSKLVLLTVARRTRSKGVDSCSRAWPRWRVRSPFFATWWSATAASVAARTLGIEKLVTFTGRVDEAWKLALYRLCDVLVMPSRLVPGRFWEDLGIALLEAAMFGKPVVGGARCFSTCARPANTTRLSNAFVRVHDTLGSLLST